MKSAKEWITARIDDLALEYHSKFYCDLSRGLQEAIWFMAHKQYADYCGMVIDGTDDRMRDEINKIHQK